MATLDWPTGRAFDVQAVRWGVAARRSAWSAFLTGQRQQVSHQADRLRVHLELAPCKPSEAGAREAFLLALARSGDWLKLYHFARPAPAGTMRGSPTLTSSASAGATTIAVTTTAGATLSGGDVIGVGTQLMQVAAAGCTANGAGAMSVPLALPLRVAVTGGAAVLWDKPVGTFQLDTDTVDLEYLSSFALGPQDLSFTEVF